MEILSRERVQRTVRQWLTFAAALVGALSGPVAAQDPLEERPPTERTSRVAIVPFTNITGVATDGWIGVGIAETLSAELQPEAFEVIAHEFLASAMRDRDLAARRAPFPRDRQPVGIERHRPEPVSGRPLGRRL